MGIEFPLPLLAMAETSFRHKKSVVVMVDIVNYFDISTLIQDRLTETGVIVRLVRRQR